MQNLKIVNIPQMKLYFEDTGTSLQRVSTPRIISFLGGAMLVDQKPVHAYYGNGFYYWETENETGCLWLRHFGLMGEGFIERDGQRHPFKAGAETGYCISYQNAAGEVQLQFYIGVDFDESGGSMFYCKLDFGGERIVDFQPGDPEQKILTTSLTKAGELHIDADFSTIWSAAGSFMPTGFYVHQMSLNFNGTYNNVTGKVTETKENGGSGKTFGLQGEIIDTEQLKTLRSARKAFQASSEKNALLKARFLENVGTTTPCSIDELFCLKQPTSITAEGKEVTGQAQVQQKTVETLYYLTIYYTADMENNGVKYQDLFGVNKSYAQERVNDVDAKIFNLLEDQEVTAYLQKYAKVALGNAIASSTDPQLQEAIKGVSNASKRCKYYLSHGTHDQSMAKDPGYHKATALITKYVYAHLVPNFKKYYNDGKAWGKALYEYSIKRLAMLKATDLAGCPRITHISMMLGFLNDEKQQIPYQDGKEEKTAELTYGAALYAKAFNMSLAEMANSVKFDQDGKATFLSVMKAVFGIIYDELQKEESDKFTAEILKELKKELENFSNMTKKDFVDSCMAVADEALSATGSFYDIISCISWVGRQFANKPWLNYCGKIVAIGLYMFSLSECVKMFAEWKDLTLDEKIESVSICLVGVMAIGETIVRWQSLKTLLNPKASVSQKVNAAARLKFGGEDFDVISGMSRAGGTELVETMENAGRYVSNIRTAGGAATEATELSRFTKAFRVAEVALRIINILVLGFVVVMLGIDIADDFKFDRPAAIKAIDILNIVFTGVACILEGVSLIIDLVGAVCDAIPVVGAICMFIGFVLGIVAEILKMKDKSDPPVIKFIKEVIVTFLNTLVEPPASWNTVALAMR